VGTRNKDRCKLTGLDRVRVTRKKRGFWGEDWNERVFCCLAQEDTLDENMIDERYEDTGEDERENLKKRRRKDI
jgi:hypothetical protein